MEESGWWKKTRGCGRFLSTTTRLPLSHAFSVTDGAEGAQQQEMSEGKFVSRSGLQSERF